MEKGNEGDEIILLALRQIDCPIDDETTIAQMSPETIVDILARSLWLISDGEVKFSPVLPDNIASRHRICTNMSTKVKELGFIGDCGYNQLLYPVESQTRALLTWIVQRLPRSEEERAEEVLGANALLNRRMTQALMDWKQISWKVPNSAKGLILRNIYNTDPFRTPNSTVLNKSHSFLFSSCNKENVSPTSSVIERHALELMNDSKYTSSLGNSDDISSQSRKKQNRDRTKVIVRNAISSVKQNSLSRNNNVSRSISGTTESRQAEQFSKSLQEIILSISKETSTGTKSKFERGTRFSHATEFAQDSVVTIGGSSSNTFGMALAAATAGLDAEDAAARKMRLESEEQTREQELANLKLSLNSTIHDVENHERQLGNDTSKIRQLESELASLQAEENNYKKEIELKKQTLQMLPNATEFIGQLQTRCGASAKKLLELAQQWEQHRRPLIEQYRAKKSSKAQRRNLCKLMVEEMKKAREEMIVMYQDLKAKRERSQILEDEMTKLPKNINRTLYTHRIMDIISSIGKQNKDIDKITADIRDIQKTISSNTSILQRADAVAEELIYSAANGVNSDPAMVDAYRQLRNMRAKFEDLLSTVSKIGQQEKLSRDLETKVDQETARLSANNSDRIKADLQQVQRENAQLVAQIKSLKSK